MRRIGVQIDGHTSTVEVRPDPVNRGVFRVLVDGEPLVVTLPEAGDGVQPDWLIVGIQPYELVFDPDLHWLQSEGRRYQLEIRDLETAAQRPSSGDGRVKAPIPGLVTRLMVEPGQRVEPGHPLLILEAMKMENEIRAPRGGIVDQIHVELGQGVARNTLLVEIR